MLSEKYVEQVGHRFVVAVVLATVVAGLAHAQCPDGSPPPCRSATVAAPSPTSLAVLYFDNASPDSTDDYLAEGLTEAIIAQLGQVGRISVKSRSAVRRFRGANVPDPPVIGRALGVAYLVTGSVQRADHALRVTIELAHTTTGMRVWGDQFVAADDSLFALQDNIARRVAEGVAGRLLPAERRAVAAVRVTHNPDAYEHFLRGNYGLAQRTSTGMARATAEYRLAAALDSGFVSALARVGLAYALRLDWSWDATGASPADSLLDRGMAAADEALRRDPSNSDAWLARGYLLEFRYPRTWDGVMAAFARAVALDPRNAEAWHQMGDAATVMGDDSTAITAWRRALAIDPGRPITLRAYAQMVVPAEARSLLDSALAVDPGFQLARLSRADTRLAQGDTSGARRDLQASHCEACAADMWPSWTAWHALSLGSLGDTAAARVEADSVLARLQGAGGLSWRVAEPLVFHYLRLGDSATALDLLERISPRGVKLWSLFTGDVSLGFYPVASSRRFRQIVSDATPPWSPPEAEIFDLPTSAATRTLWVGTYAGVYGRVRVYARQDRLIVALEGRELGPLQYQGGNTFVASWDHHTRVVSGAGDIPVEGFTVTRRKRVVTYRRVP
ncbi:MAG: hypothetical protein AUH78_12290 [Gemmatimonadetes bacterium 13_1_40CM_4_69_8]|nr:MAG: hypothetical protein AUH78_12290 [Gemmatimonadetes bacterium 13_1_40CM_4_69_8]